VPCYISSSVKDECDEKIRELLDFVGSSIVSLRMHIAGEKTKTQHEIVITEPDILLIELLVGDLFKELTEKAKTEGREPPDIEQNLLRLLEGSLVDFFEQEFKKHASLSMEELESFLAQCLDKFLYIEEAFHLQMKSLTQKIQIDPDSTVINEINRIGIPKEDGTHIASAMQYSLSNKTSTVFVSVDYKHIINFQVQLYERFKFQVSDPVYAFYHLKNEDVFRDVVALRMH